LFLRQHLEGKYVDDVGVFVIDSGLQHHAIWFEFVVSDFGEICLIVRVCRCLFVSVSVVVARVRFEDWRMVDVLQIILAHVKLYNISKTRCCLLVLVRILMDGECWLIYSNL